MPEEMAGPYRQALTKLQEAAPPMPVANVHKVMAEQLGADWRERFAEFDDSPAAAASIGQVHKALWKLPPSRKGAKPKTLPQQSSIAPCCGQSTVSRMRAGATAAATGAANASPHPTPPTNNVSGVANRYPRWRRLSREYRRSSPRGQSLVPAPQMDTRATCTRPVARTDGAVSACAGVVVGAGADVHAPTMTAPEATIRARRRMTAACYESRPESRTVPVMPALDRRRPPACP